MPVAFSKSGMTGFGSSSSQLMMFSSPEEDSAFCTIHGPVAATEPTAAPVFRKVRREKRRAASIVSSAEVIGLSFLVMNPSGSARAFRSSDRPLYAILKN